MVGPGEAAQAYRGFTASTLSPGAAGPGLIDRSQHDDHETSDHQEQAEDHREAHRMLPRWWVTCRSICEEQGEILSDRPSPAPGARATVRVDGLTQCARDDSNVRPLAPEASALSS